MQPGGVLVRSGDGGQLARRISSKKSTDLRNWLQLPLPRSLHRFTSKKVCPAHKPRTGGPALQMQPRRLSLAVWPSGGNLGAGLSSRSPARASRILPVAGHGPLGEHLGKLEGVAHRWLQQARGPVLLAANYSGRPSEPPRYQPFFTTQRRWGPFFHDAAPMGRPAARSVLCHATLSILTMHSTSTVQSPAHDQDDQLVSSHHKEGLGQ